MPTTKVCTLNLTFPGHETQTQCVCPSPAVSCPCDFYRNRTGRRRANSSIRCRETLTRAFRAVMQTVVFCTFFLILLTRPRQPGRVSTCGAVSYFIPSTIRGSHSPFWKVTRRRAQRLKECPRPFWQTSLRVSSPFRLKNADGDDVSSVIPHFAESWQPRSGGCGCLSGTRAKPLSHVCP